MSIIDIDLLLVRADGIDADRFENDISAVSRRGSRLTGNDVRPLVHSLEELAQGATRHPVLGEILRDGVMLRGDMKGLRRAIAN